MNLKKITIMVLVLFVVTAIVPERSKAAFPLVAGGFLVAVRIAAACARNSVCRRGAVWTGRVTGAAAAWEGIDAWQRNLWCRGPRPHPSC